MEVVDGIVRAEVSGAFNLENAKLFFLRILEHARDHGVDRVLIDTRSIEGDISASARFDFGTFMAEARPAPIRIALVGSADAVWPDRILESVAVNRGVLAKVATDVGEATEWLERDHSPAGG